MALIPGTRLGVYEVMVRRTAVRRLIDLSRTLGGVGSTCSSAGDWTALGATLKHLITLLNELQGLGGRLTSFTTIFFAGEIRLEIRRVGDWRGRRARQWAGLT